MPQIKDKSVGLLVNHSSLVGDIHLVDTLLSLGVDIRKIFAPEHGFRGNADAGELIRDDKDAATGIPIISLYGKQKKPSSRHLEDLDLLIFDIQDVGARFFTYISTMHLMMEACAEAEIPLLILDRPNPNAHYVDGPVLQLPFKSFVGMHPIPVVHGMTIGELALMINGEKWLLDSLQCDLQVITVKQWSRKQAYILPVKPSPNLPNAQAIALYPSLCFFEGTVVSVGRGTEFPFQVWGFPNENFGDFSFTPVSRPGAKRPKYENQVCYGVDLRTSEKPDRLKLDWLIRAYKHYAKNDFFNSFFDKLAGTDQLRKQIINGKSETQIRASWQVDLDTFRLQRKKYLLYEE
jgi:uncharacterized protein YbbC (DUF1343 family)